MKATNETLRNLRPGFATKPMTFGKVSTWFERSGDGQTVRLIRETVFSKTSSITEVVKSFSYFSI